MPFVLRCPDGDTAVDVEFDTPSATVADLIDAIRELLVPAAPASLPPLALVVEGRALDPERALRHAGIPDGAVVSVVPASSVAGSRTDKRAHTASTGQRQATTPFNRPPRPAPPAEPEPLDLPEPPPHSTGSAPFSAAAIVAPLLMAALLAVVFHNVMWGLFSLLGPVMFVGTWLEQRRRGHTTSRRLEVQWRTSLIDLAHAIHHAAANERDRRCAVLTDGAELHRRAALRTSRVWERRPGHDDWLVLRAGTGDVPWEPPTRGGRPRAAEVVAMLGAATPLPNTPVALELTTTRIVGIVGDRPAALDVARALVVQAAVNHGPADLAVVVATDPDAAGSWGWTRWLPHVIDHRAGRRRVATTPPDGDELARDVWTDGSPARTTLLVVDDRALATHRRSAVRSTLQSGHDHVIGIVLASHADQLPWSCSAVIDVRTDGAGCLDHLGHGDGPLSLRADAMSLADAERVARDLARLSDPELDTGHSALPARVSLAGLLGRRAADAQAIREAWEAAGTDPAPAAAIGVCSDGTCTVDLATDGPHTLIAGTTGSGKSELLRTLVAALAAGSPPDQLAFVLIDFKGGAAFDAVAGLPHVVGMVTDLDERAASRAVRGLEAELRRRERLLRDANAEDLVAYRAGLPTEPIARLVVVIDEFATLAADQPDVLDALVGVAQRGRSMGVHLVLATQRPAGSVNDHVRANTNLRIALRVQDPHDSLDVLDVPDAAAISRHRPGRALVRLGPGELRAMQGATGSGVAGHDAADAVRLVPFATPGTGRIARALATPNARAAPEAPTPPSARVATEIEQLDDAIRAASEARGTRLPRQPWPDPLPQQLALADVPLRNTAATADTPEVLIGLADDPDHQRRLPVGWQLDAGHLLLVGGPRSGTTTALAALAARLADAAFDRPCHLYVVDLGGGGLEPIADLPGVGAVIGAAETERQRRLAQHLADELDARLATPDEAKQRPRLVVLVDGIGALLAAWDDPLEPVAAQLGRVVADGAAQGIHVAMSAHQMGAMPMSWLSAITQRGVFQLADAAEYAYAGIAPAMAPDAVAGRAVWFPAGLATQVGEPAKPLGDHLSHPGAAGDRAAHPASVPARIATLPRRVLARELLGSLDVRDACWQLPVGLANRSLRPALVTLHPGEHLLVAGAARSGLTTALAGLAALIASATATTRPEVVAVCRTHSGLRATRGVDRWIDPDDTGELAHLADADHQLRGALVLVDDAERLADPGGALAALVADAPPRVHLAVAGHAAALRSAYGHWARTVPAAGVGVLLRPDADLDGDLLATSLPRRTPAPMAPGRGWLVDRGTADYVQLIDVD